MAYWLSRVHGRGPGAGCDYRMVVSFPVPRGAPESDSLTRLHGLDLL